MYAIEWVYLNWNMCYWMCVFDLEICDVEYLYLNWDIWCEICILWYGGILHNKKCFQQCVLFPNVHIPYSECCLGNINTLRLRQNGCQFCRQHFQMHFLEWKGANFNQYSTGVCSLGLNWKSISIGSDNGLAPNKWQTIIWANDALFHWRIYPSLGLSELTLRRSFHFIWWALPVSFHEVVTLWMASPWSQICNESLKLDENCILGN